MNTSWLAIILIAVLAIGYFVVRGNRGKKIVRLPRIFSGKPLTTEEIDAATEAEEEENARLQEVLEAKQRLMAARAKSAKLRRDIESTTERTPSGEKPKVRRIM